MKVTLDNFCFIIKTINEPVISTIFFQMLNTHNHKMTEYKYRDLKTTFCYLKKKKKEQTNI